MSDYCRVCNCYSRTDYCKFKRDPLPRVPGAVRLGNDHRLFVVCSGCLRYTYFDHPFYFSEIGLNRSSADPEHYKMVLKSVYARFDPGREIARYFRKMFRTFLFNARQEAARFVWSRDLDPETVEWISSKLLDIERREHASCVDNWRVAEVSSRRQMKQYKRAKAQGCCGSLDTIVTHPSGRIFALGFNYGH